MTVSEPTKHHTRYSVEISTEDMLAILIAEQKSWSFKHLYEKVNDVIGFTGTTGCEYDGHFGAQVLYSLDANIDNPLTHATIAKIIEDHITLCKKNQRKRA
jgi:hypothetical protein